MSLLPIHLLGSPVLREPSAPVAEVTAEVRRLVDDMFETMEAAEGVGLAANQVGQAVRIAVVDAEGSRIVMINPIISEASGKDREEEGCLSIPDVYGEVTRPERIVLEATGKDGAPYRLEADGLLARVIQHEIDHLDGILFLDRLSPMKRRLLVAKYRREHKEGGGLLREVARPSGRTP
ncbi:MAG: peptide deformylase [Gemmatimonadales bacterium]|jgi:peptide deformylase|nr:MAG: peptide deformylase [Gemmatimonadales bacterium]